MRDYKQLNGLTLAYVGDTIYEIYIRDYLVPLGQTGPNVLHRTATHYVSAKVQASLVQAILVGEMLMEEEEMVYERGRGTKSHTLAKNADVATHRVATGFESLMGYLYLTQQKEHLEELINQYIKKVGEISEK